MKDKMCWDNVAACAVNMLGMGDIYAEPSTCNRSEVVVHGYSFECRETNKPLFDAVVAFIVPRLPHGMEIEIAIVCPDGLLEHRIDGR